MSDAAVAKVSTGAIAKQLATVSKVALSDSHTMAILDLPEPSHKLATDFVQVMVCSQTLDGLSNWYAGHIISTIKENEAKYGENTVNCLAAIVNRTSRWAYAVAKVADVFPDIEHVRNLLSKPIGKDGKGGLMSFSHLVEITRLTTATQQQKFVAMTIKQGLSVRDLSKAISEFLDGKNTGRATPAEALDHVVSIFRQLPDKIQTFSHFVSDIPIDFSQQLEPTVDEELTVDDLEKVKAAIENGEKIIESMSDVMQNLHATCERLTLKFHEETPDEPEDTSAEVSDVTEGDDTGEEAAEDTAEEVADEVSEPEEAAPTAKKTLKAPKK